MLKQTSLPPTLTAQNEQRTTVRIGDRLGGGELNGVVAAQASRGWLDPASGIDTHMHRLAPILVRDQ